MKRLALALLGLVYWIVAAVLLLAVCAALQVSDFTCGATFGGLAVGGVLSALGAFDPCRECGRD